jgi:predicted flap endonuclease-1-like 5' DNA nuclease
MKRRFGWGLLIGMLVAGACIVLIRWWLRQQARESRRRQSSEYIIPTQPEDSPAITQPANPESHSKRASPVPAGKIRDDLKIIEGIGPKSAQILAKAGITSFRQLATTETGQLSQILRDAGLRLVFPDTWAEQAALAGNSDWEGLRALQGQLNRGRRVQP